MKLKCAIVDDEPLAIELLVSYVNKIPFMELTGRYANAVETMKGLAENPVDVLFLDIQMPDLNGMELAHMIPPTTRVIFTTAFKEYAFESYEVSALDFLLKPIRYNKFLAAVEKAKQWYEREPSADDAKSTSLFIRVDGELRNVTIDNITYVSGMKDYVMFYLDGESKPLITHLTMKAVEAMLPTDRFLRVHRSYIIAVDKIKKIDRNDCIYIGEEIIHVPEGYQQAFHSFIETRSF